MDLLDRHSFEGRRIFKDDVEADGRNSGVV